MNRYPTIRPMQMQPIGLSVTESCTLGDSGTGGGGRTAVRAEPALSDSIGRQSIDTTSPLSTGRVCWRSTIPGGLPSYTAEH